MSGATLDIEDAESQPQLVLTLSDRQFREGESPTVVHATAQLIEGGSFEDDVVLQLTDEPSGSSAATPGVDYTLSPPVPRTVTLTAGSRSAGRVEGRPRNR